MAFAWLAAVLIVCIPVNGLYLRSHRSAPIPALLHNIENKLTGLGDSQSTLADRLAALKVRRQANSKVEITKLVKDTFGHYDAQMKNVMANKAEQRIRDYLAGRPEDKAPPAPIVMDKKVIEKELKVPSVSKPDPTVAKKETQKAKQEVVVQRAQLKQAIAGGSPPAIKAAQAVVEASEKRVENATKEEVVAEQEAVQEKVKEQQVVVERAAEAVKEAVKRGAPPAEVKQLQKRAEVARKPAVLPTPPPPPPVPISTAPPPPTNSATPPPPPTNSATPPPPAPIHVSIPPQKDNSAELRSISSSITGALSAMQAQQSTILQTVLGGQAAAKAQAKANAEKLAKSMQALADAKASGASPQQIKVLTQQVDQDKTAPATPAEAPPSVDKDALQKAVDAAVQKLLKQKEASGAQNKKNDYLAAKVETRKKELLELQSRETEAGDRVKAAQQMEQQAQQKIKESENKVKLAEAQVAEMRRKEAAERDENEKLKASLGNTAQGQQDMRNQLKNIIGAA